MEESVLVSVICTAYNHENYIRDALDGFVAQKTSFRFEVLVHDDASTDGTAMIIKEYAEKYPEIIKPIFQTENQYSQGKDITDFLYSLAKGKYIALCEGDDCWVDAYKLQKQAEYMETHPACTLCITNGYLCHDKKPVKKIFASGEITDVDFDMTKIAAKTPTASLFYPRKIMMEAPQLDKRAFNGDEFIRLYATSQGYAHYIDEITCCYNQGVENSATTIWSSNSEYYIEHLQRVIVLYHDIDRFTEGKYHDFVLESLDLIQYKIILIRYLMTRDRQWSKLLKQEKYRMIAKSSGGKSYLEYILTLYCFPLYYLVFETKLRKYLGKIYRLVKRTK